MMHNIALSLIRDFRTNLIEPGFCSDLESAVKAQDIASIRQLAPTAKDGMDAALYKATYQMASLFKRYRCRNDIYSDEELITKAIQGFHDTQRRIRAVPWDNLSCSTRIILEGARVYIAKVLGEYSDEEHRNLCRFGSRASVGIPARKACEAARWELPISGSLEQISWFDSEMSRIDCVQEYWYRQLVSDPNRSNYQEVSSLKLALVPKTFKSMRAIMPNTTIGSYMSLGLGEMIRLRLRRKGYDIKTLQQRHRYLARLASKHQLLVTADLSSASDSISVELVRRLFPKTWFDILNLGRIGTICLPDGQCVESSTFCTMGIGFTFPLQTLVFLALLKSTEATLFHRLDRRTISVYGDDLIYSRRIHPDVVRVFSEIGFVINIDKTFVDGEFRESCGGDYYRGVDVRPFQPRNGAAEVGPKAYEAMLYKCVNGLLARWSEHEIERTLRFLTSEIESVTGRCKLVPGNYPDDSGIKVPTIAFYEFVKRAACAFPKHVGHGMYRFSFLRLVPDEQEETRHEPYYWNAVRGRMEPAFFHTSSRHPVVDQTLLREEIDRRFDLSDVQPPLITREVVPIITFRSCLTGRRLRRTTTFVTLSHTGRYMRQSGISCFEIRR
jgi:hypothetical protein